VPEPVSLGMDTTTPDLGPQAARVARLVAGVRDEQLGNPTPCDGTTVAGMLDHLVGLTTAFTMAARKETVTGTPRASADELIPDWRERLPRQLAELAEAWRKPGAWEGMASVAGAELPSMVMGVVAADEVLVHGWDLAVATGQDYDADPGVAAAVLHQVTMLTQPGMEELRDGQFGPVVPVPDDAPVLDRILGLTGRSLSWRP
jgi:uncharacterized protein (TIGR03086 family)